MALWWSWGGGHFLMGEVPMHTPHLHQKSLLREECTCRAPKNLREGYMGTSLTRFASSRNVGI